MGRHTHRQQNYTLNRGTGNEAVRKYQHPNSGNSFQHDDRGLEQERYTGGESGPRRSAHSRLGGQQRQVSFGDDGRRAGDGPVRRGGISKRGPRGRGGSKWTNNKIHVDIAYLDEGDDGMGGEEGGAGIHNRGGMRGRGKFRGYRGGPGRTPPGIIVKRPPSAASVFSWHKIVLKNGSKYDKIRLLKQLLSKCPLPFIPIAYNKKGMNTEFFLEDQAAARALKELDKKIEMEDGYPLQINTERSTPPNMAVTDELVEKIKVVMSKRYIVEHKALNMKAFHLDEAFAGESFYAPLWRSNIMNKVLTIIIDNIPELSAIDMSENKLTSPILECFTTFKTKAKELKILHLANNRIADTRPLERLKGLDLIEIKLEGNPIVQNLGSSYQEAIRKIFPKLKTLDDKELPAKISFEDEDEEKTSGELPASIPKMVKNEGAAGLVLTFLEQFFKLYDSDSRQPLLEAYHENAMFSMSAWGRHDLLASYIPESRNLIKVDYEKKRHDLLKIGKLGVVAFLAKLPKTEHDMNTFTLDSPFSNESMMIFTVTGCFRERDTKQASIRHFNRCFVVVPQNQGFVIANETLFISQAQDLSKRKAFMNPQPSTMAAAPVVDEATQRSLANSFSEKSGMNLEFSAKCLEENGWDFERAATVFSDAKQKGIIPQEAFKKM